MLRPSRLFLAGGFSLIALALALLPLPVAGALLGAIGFGILAFIEPIWALYAAILSVPIQELVYLPGGITVTQATLVLLAAVWVLHTLAHPERHSFGGLPMIGLAALIWTLVLASLTTPYSQIEAFKQTYRWATVVLVYLASLNMLLWHSRKPQKLSWQVVGLIGCLILAPTIDSVIGLRQFFIGEGPPSFHIGGTPFSRAYGTIGEPNSFAGYLNQAWPLALALTLGLAWHFETFNLRAWFGLRATSLWRSPSFSKHLIVLGTALCTFLMLFALTVSLSRGSWLGTIAGLIAMLGAIVLLVKQDSRFHGIQERIWQGSAIIAGGGVLLLLLGSLGLLPEMFTKRFSSILTFWQPFDFRSINVTADNFSLVHRMALMQSAWNMFQTFPWTGVGPGNYTMAYEGRVAFQPLFGFHPWYYSTGHAHNYYLHIAAEAGIIGFIAYLLLIGMLCAQALGSLHQARGWFWRSIVVGSCGIIGTVTVHNLFENLHVLNLGIQLGAVWGLLVVAEKSAEGGNLQNYG